MKLTIKKLLVSVGLVGLAALALSACTPSKTSSTASGSAKVTDIAVAISADSNPYEYKDASGKLTGFEYDLLNLIDKDLPQYSFSYQVYRDDALLNAVTASRAQIAANNFGKTDERLQTYLFSYPTSKGSNAIFSRTSSPITSIEGLFGKTTEIPTGTNYGKIMTDWNNANPGKKININYSGNTLVDRLNEISSGKIDFLFADKKAAENLVKTQAISGVVDNIPSDMAKYPAFNTYSYFVLAQGQNQLQKAINAEIKKFSENGTLKTLSEKYFGDDRVPTADMMK